MPMGMGMAVRMIMRRMMSSGRDDGIHGYSHGAIQQQRAKRDDLHDGLQSPRPVVEEARLGTDLPAVEEHLRQHNRGDEQREADDL